MKKWRILSESGIRNPSTPLRTSQESEIKDLIKILLSNRGIKTKKDADDFLHPKLEDITIKNVGIDKKQLQKAISRIQKAIQDKEKIVVFGDYDVDGICGTAILWETLNSLGAKVMPYIPHRVDEGYGLSIKGIQNVITSSHPELGSGSRFRNKFGMTNNRVQHDNERGLIITVDNGIVANKAVEFANKQGIDVIITDHHVPLAKPPKALAIVHTVKLCGTGVAWMLSNVILNEVKNLRDPSSRQIGAQDDNREESHLELVALATVADLVPLIGANRTLLKFGLDKLRQTKRVGLLELFKEAVLDKNEIDVYEIGHIIAPRLNAMGRLEYAMDSLRLLCTNNKKRAEGLAQLLESTNRERQTLTIETVEHAKSIVYSSSDTAKPGSREVIAEDSSRQARTITQKLLFIADESYQQGIIGLVAGKLVEEFYRPSIVVSIGEKYSKASARSVSGFNIIEFIRSASELLVDAGGHPMAAGFTVETTKLSLLQKIFEERANELLDEEMLKRTLRIDCNLPLDLVDNDLYDAIQRLAPFGMGNPEPTFVSRKVVIEDMRVVGAEGKHIKLRLSQHNLNQVSLDRHSGKRGTSASRISQDDGRFWTSQNDRALDAIGFGMGERSSEFNIGDKVAIVYTIDEDKWLAPRSSVKPNEVGNGNKRLQLKIKDLKKS